MAWNGQIGEAPWTYAGSMAASTGFVEDPYATPYFKISMSYGSNPPSFRASETFYNDSRGEKWTKDHTMKIFKDFLLKIENGGTLSTLTMTGQNWAWQQINEPDPSIPLAGTWKWDLQGHKAHARYHFGSWGSPKHSHPIVRPAVCDMAIGNLCAASLAVIAAVGLDGVSAAL